MGTYIHHQFSSKFMTVNCNVGREDFEGDFITLVWFWLHWKPRVVMMMSTLSFLVAPYGGTVRCYQWPQCCIYFMMGMHINGLTHWGRDKMAAVSQTTLSNALSWMKILEFRSRFHWRSLFLRVQLTIIRSLNKILLLLYFVSSQK